MNSPATDLSRYLQTLGLLAGFVVGVALEPAKPQNVVTLYDTGGEGPDTDELNLYRPTVQVRVRAASYPAGHSAQMAAQLALHAIAGRVIEGTRYVSVTALTDIAHIGNTDGDDLYLLTCNYQLLREPT